MPEFALSLGQTGYIEPVDLESLLREIFPNDATSVYVRLTTLPIKLKLTHYFITAYPRQI
jgi:hypothetical protein